MLKQIGNCEYTVTHLDLDERESARLEELLQRRSETAVRFVAEAVERAQGRISERPLSELLSHAR